MEYQKWDCVRRHVQQKIWNIFSGKCYSYLNYSNRRLKDIVETLYRLIETLQRKFFQNQTTQNSCIMTSYLHGKKLKMKSVKFVFIDIFTFTNVLDLSFFSAHIFSESPKNFRFLVMLLYIIGKKVIFSKFSNIRLQVFVLLFLKLMQHIWSEIYQIYIQHIYWANLVQKFKIVSLS